MRGIEIWGEAGWEGGYDLNIIIENDENIKLVFKSTNILGVTGSSVAHVGKSTNHKHIKKTGDTG